MLLDSKSLVSMREANQNFSRVAKKADTQGSVVIMKNNRPAYLLMPYTEESTNSTQEEVSDELVSLLVQQFADRYERALTELAK